MPRDFPNLSKRQQRRILSNNESSPNRSAKVLKLNSESEFELKPRESLEGETPHFCSEADDDNFSTAGCIFDVTPPSLFSVQRERPEIQNPEIQYPKIQSPEKRTLTNSLSDDLRKCFHAHNISQSCIKDMLGILRRHVDNELPKDARSLMRTPRCLTNIVNIGGGQYIHFGLEEGIKRAIVKYSCTNSIISFNINIDGLPISKSSGSQFWPILGDIVKRHTYTEPFVIGVFHGLKKPEDSNEFLKYFVEEYLSLKITGLVLQNKSYSIQLNCVICDAPAKAFISNTKHHSGYFGCSKCICEGDYVEHRVVYLSTTSSLRTNQSFRNRTQPEHHHGSTVLESLDIDMIKQIPLDYMHLVLLGVSKRILTLWLKGPKNVRLTKTQIEHFNQLYLETSKFSVSDFSRKPRSIHEVDRWKATKFRFFLLYAGPVILQKILTSNIYNHFMSLVVAIRLLCETNQSNENIDYANELLLYFVKKFGEIFGPAYMSYNVHNLIHLAGDVKAHGGLDEFSAFKYENLMYKIKRKLKHSSLPLQQLHNRLMEGTSLETDPIESKFPKSITKKGTIFGIELQNFSVLLKENENCCLLTDGRIVIINNIIKVDNNLYFSGKYYQSIIPLFCIPCNSTLLNIYKVDDENILVCNEQISVTLISKKMLKLPFGNEYVLVPLLH